ncbi:MAG: DUF4242 domain-containing protein [Burkholderiales bacterium]
MPKYVIERELPGAGQLSREQLRAVAQKSNGVIESLGKNIQWVHTYVVDDKLYCVYNADSPKIIEEHAKCGGFPANRISRVRSIMDPTTAEA